MKIKLQITARTAHKKCAYHCAQPSYTTQHWTVLIIFSLILQRVIIAQMLLTGREGNQHKRHRIACNFHRDVFRRLTTNSLWVQMS